MDIEELEQIIKILKQNDVGEFEFDNNGVRIKVSRSAPVSASHSTVHIEPAITVHPTHTTHATAPKAPEENIDHLFKVQSQMVGTFYRKSSPDADPFVTEGTIVKKGDVLCIVEAMKLMNEIDSPISGKIERVLAQDGQVVEYGEVLFLINPQA